MLSIGALSSAAQGASYYERDGYYAKDSEEHRDASAWAGKGAEELGLTGPVDPDTFRAVLEGHVPDGSGTGATPARQGSATARHRRRSRARRRCASPARARASTSACDGARCRRDRRGMRGSTGLSADCRAHGGGRTIGPVPIAWGVTVMALAAGRSIAGQIIGAGIGDVCEWNAR